MKWRTIIEPIDHPLNITLDSSVLLLGSCFAENIGYKMRDNKFLADINPTGISYNPVSLAENIRRACQQDIVFEKELLNNGEKYIHFDFHSSLGHFDVSTCLQKINEAIEQLHNSIQKADFIFMSLGSAVVFEHLQNQAIVSNCHKFPKEEFNKRQLDISEITDSLHELLKDIYQLNPEVNIILTVSPVRHARHGLIENNKSKAKLIAAVHELVDNDDQLYYFPSYEIIMDDLRDYRFYASDLVHPSEEAIEYIWSYLEDHYMTGETQQDIKSIKSLMDSSKHKLMNSSPEKKKEFLLALKDKMMNHKYYERFIREISDIDNRINTLTKP